MTDPGVKNEFCFPRILLNGYRDEVEGNTAAWLPQLVERRTAVRTNTRGLKITD